MRIFLLKDVKGIGRVNEIKNVSDGYARNFLIPRKLAVPADKKAIGVKKEIDKKEEDRVEEYKELAKKLADEKLTFKLKVGEKNEVFGSVSSTDIDKVLEGGIYRDGKVELVHSLKELGEHKVEVGFPNGIKGLVTVVVEKE